MIREYNRERLKDTDSELEGEEENEFDDDVSSCDDAAHNNSQAKDDSDESESYCSDEEGKGRLTVLMYFPDT